MLRLQVTLATQAQSSSVLQFSPVPIQQQKKGLASEFTKWFKEKPYENYLLPSCRSEEKSEIRKSLRLITYMLHFLPKTHNVPMQPMPTSNGSDQIIWLGNLKTYSNIAQENTISFLATYLQKSPVDN
jgi:hypothetical protein